MQYFYETFSKFKRAEGALNQSSKRQLLAYASFEVEKHMLDYMVYKLFPSCIQICAQFICQLSRF